MANASAMRPSKARSMRINILRLLESNIIKMMKTASKSAAVQTRVLTAHVPSSLAQKVDQLAERMERPRGWIIKQALLAWVEEEEERHRLTLEALEEVESGKGIQH